MALPAVTLPMQPPGTAVLPPAQPTLANIASAPDTEDFAAWKIHRQSDERLPAERVEPTAEHLAAGIPPPQALPTDRPAPPLQATPPDNGLRERLIETVSQLLVTPAQGANPQVRMVLQESVLPGTTVVVQQTAAQLQVSFECSAQVSRQRLERAAPAFAQSLARRLGRDVVVQIQDGTGSSLPPVEAHAHAGEATG
ncbi:MAG: type III secretion HpaP family protein [Ramlibacter sp.]